MPTAPSRAPPPLVVAIEGPSGAGKSSVARALATRLNGTLIEEAYVRIGRTPSLAARTPAALATLELRLLEEESERFANAEAQRRQGVITVLDTGYLGPLTYTWGLRESDGGPRELVEALVTRARELLDIGRIGLPDLTLYLDIPESLAGERAGQDPAGHPAALRERHQRVGRYERLLYQREFPHALPGRFASVAADGSPATIAAAVADRLEQFGGIPPAWRGETERLLALFEPPEVIVPSAAAPPSEGTDRHPPTVKKRPRPRPLPPR
jgi:thymidylate kinase